MLHWRNLVGFVVEDRARMHFLGPSATGLRRWGGRAQSIEGLGNELRIGAGEQSGGVWGESSAGVRFRQSHPP